MTPRTNSEALHGFGSVVRLDQVLIERVEYWIDVTVDADGIGNATGRIHADGNALHELRSDRRGQLVFQDGRLLDFLVSAEGEIAASSLIYTKPLA